MVLIESGSLNVEGLSRMAGVIEGHLKQSGFNTERRKATAGAGADIVVATRKGTGKRKIMLQSHMDTVYQPGILDTQPYKVEGNRIHGPGIADDKGGIAVILASLKILADAGWRDHDTLNVVFNPDEQVGRSARVS
jgi:glutamate carboxypeptidase